MSRALFAVGLATFAILYCVQPLQPVPFLIVDESARGGRPQLAMAV